VASLLGDRGKRDVTALVELEPLILVELDCVSDRQRNLFRQVIARELVGDARFHRREIVCHGLSLPSPSQM
jgi:hypothetical protein